MSTRKNQSVIDSEKSFLLVLFVTLLVFAACKKSDNTGEGENKKKEIIKIIEETEDIKDSIDQQHIQDSLAIVREHDRQDSLAWLKAQALNTIESYRIYTEKYPEGNYLKDATKIILSSTPALSIIKNSVNGYDVTTILRVAPEFYTLKRLRLDWGDGKSENVNLNANSNAQLKHTYPRLGNYGAQLLVEDEFGRTTTKNYQVSIGLPTDGRVGYWPLNKVDNNFRGDDCYGEVGRKNKRAIAMNRSSFCGSLGSGGAPAYYDAGRLKLPANYSISFWVASESNGNGAFIIGQTGNNFENDAGVFFTDGPIDVGSKSLGKYGHLSFVVYNKSNPFVITDNKKVKQGQINGSVQENAWTHYVITARRTGGSTSYTLFRDGDQVTEQTSNANNTGNGNSFIFGKQQTDNDDYGYFSGRLSDIMVFNRPLSGSEIKMLYNH